MPAEVAQGRRLGLHCVRSEFLYERLLLPQQTERVRCLLRAPRCQTRMTQDLAGRETICPGVSGLCQGIPY